MPEPFIELKNPEIKLVGRSFVIFIEFGIHIKVFNLMSLFETCSTVQVANVWQISY